MPTTSRILFFGFASFVATLGIEKQRETRRKTSWETGETKRREGGHTDVRRLHLHRLAGFGLDLSLGNRKIKMEDELVDKV